MTTRILLADDHTMMRDGLRAVIEREDGLSIVGEARNGMETVEQARSKAPHLIVMDVGMPDLNGIEATRQILAERPHTRVVALSVHADRRYVAEMLRAGASGYLLKRSAAEELIRAIRSVMKGQTYLSPEVAGGVVETFLGEGQGAPQDRDAFSELTARERQVLQVLAEGLSTKAIADRLGIGVKTVETHRRNLALKLHLHSVAELTKYAVRQGITSPE
jgi:DNA-binding NarL/FixJ family response regulator